MIRFLLFMLWLPTQDPAPKLRGGAFGTRKPMPYATAFMILLVIAIIVLRLVSFPHGVS